MADVINFQSNTGKNIISDDATSTLTLENESTTLDSYALDANGLTLTVSPTRIPAANATVNSFNIAGPSRASGAVLGFESNALVSLTTVDSTEGGVAGTYGVRVLVGDGNFGWIPIYPDGAITGAAL